MGIQKYTVENIEKAIAMRIEGKTIPEIVQETGIKIPSLKKLFREKGIKLNQEQKNAALSKRWENHNPIIDGRKVCGKCQVLKNLEEFHTSSNSFSGFTSSCKECYKKYYKENADGIKKRTNDYKKNNPEKVKYWDKKRYTEKTQEYIERAASWAKNNPERKREIERKYDKANQPKKNARTAKRRAVKIKATPSWLSEHQLDEIRRMYENCPKGFHVDHIVPLRGENVSGLHVPWNLQYLSAEENLRKSNKLTES